MLDRVSQSSIPYLYRPDTNKNINLVDANYRNGFEPADSKFIKVDLSEKALKKLGIKRCETCEQRKYQDSSNDPGVSFKAPTHLSPEQASSAVAMHEREHVSHEQANARAEGKEVVYQSVRIYTDACPECGRIYVSGGETTTMTKNKSKQNIEPRQVLDIYA